MRTRLTLPIAGVTLAVAITTTMDATGYFAFSALPLFPLMLLFWYLSRLTRREMGFVRGDRTGYALAILHPLAVMGAIAAIAGSAGAIDTAQTDWGKAALNVGLVAGTTILVAIVTEEGFFRGWLWGALGQAGKAPGAVLLWTSLAFAAWHIAPITLSTGFDVPAAQVPVYLVNAAALGAIWGVLRLISGSIVVASVGHGLWNGLAYVLFGFGTREGALGIADTPFYGPEVGVLGLALNLAVLAGLLWRFRDRLVAPVGG
jgi:uncharacterized protein